MFVLAIKNDLQAQLPCVPHRTGILEKDTVIKKPEPYRNIREADIAWIKRVYSIIDFKHKMNQMFSSKGSFNNDKVGFIDILFCAVREGIINVYADDKFTNKMATNGLIPVFQSKDTINYINPKTNKPEIAKVIVQSDINDVVALKIKEDWLIDKNYGFHKSRIIGICPMIIERDTAGDFVRNKEMFWIYFPDLRNLLVNIDIYSKGEPKDTITWDDIFTNRFFSSTIVKESNNRDRMITDYRTGKDAIIESDQIKITNQDMDLDMKDY